MKTNHGAKIRKNLKATFGKYKTLNVHDNSCDFQGWNHLWERMTPEEREWAEKFERLEYQIERGYAKEAIEIAVELNPDVSDAAVQQIRDDVSSKERCNPAKAESFNNSRTKQKTGKRAPNKNMYDASDWVRHGGLIPSDDELQDNGEPALIEKGITVSPEDAIIEALDAAAAHGVSLEDFLNNPKYHTPERKAGRPKKMEVVK